MLPLLRACRNLHSFSAASGCCKAQKEIKKQDEDAFHAAEKLEDAVDARDAGLSRLRKVFTSAFHAFLRMCCMCFADLSQRDLGR
ncbi:unnamed protein product [Symbiodinium natans]|uniref:Uncharacterized protein n=1 Tax=Symbiodinium natans TaxID=878477 RepID=A0A812SK70_9DINO|nr:unnamed protein product [Symbiodinium natans]